MTTAHAGLYGPDTLTTRQGGPARHLIYTVLVAGSIDLADLYLDRDRTTPASNPGRTDQLGNLTWYAEPGDYDLIAGDSTLRIQVPIDPLDVGSIDGSALLDAANTFTDAPQTIVATPPLGEVVAPGLVVEVAHDSVSQVVAKLIAMRVAFPGFALQQGALVLSTHDQATDLPLVVEGVLTYGPVGTDVGRFALLSMPDGDVFAAGPARLSIAAAEADDEAVVLQQLTDALAGVPSEAALQALTDAIAGLDSTYATDGELAFALGQLNATFATDLELSTAINNERAYVNSHGWGQTLFSSFFYDPADPTPIIDATDIAGVVVPIGGTSLAGDGKMVFTPTTSRVRVCMEALCWAESDSKLSWMLHDDADAPVLTDSGSFRVVAYGDGSQAMRHVEVTVNVTPGVELSWRWLMVATAITGSTPLVHYWPHAHYMATCSIYAA